jgi:LacI family transcriptional regulator
VAAVSIKDVALAAGVSIGTVSNVLNHPEKVSGETAGRVQAAIVALGFVRNDAARQLRAGHSTTIGLIVLDMRNPFFTDIARAAEDRAAADGLAVVLANSGDDAARESAYLDLFEEQRMLGVLISPIGDVTDRLHRLRARGIRAVLVDRSGDDPELSSVSVDDVAGGRIAAEHLLSIGRRRIAFVGGPSGFQQVTDRHRGARAAVDAVPGATLEVVDVPALSVLAGRTAGAAILARAPRDRPDAVFAVNDLVAMGVLQAFVLQGVYDVAVPGDIAIVGYDDIDFASAAVVPLSSVRQPSALIGRTAVEILLDEARDPGIAPRRIVFQPELVVRESTSAIT